MPSARLACRHVSLVVDTPSRDDDGYSQPEWGHRVAATTPSGRFPKDAPKQEPETHRLTFPAPLVLPDDELSYEPTYPPQSLRSWASLTHRNKLTPDRKTVYVARTPSIPEHMPFMLDWATPTFPAKGKGKKRTVATRVSSQPPQFDGIVDYLRAFYHGLEVKAYNPDLCYQPWQETLPSQDANTANMSGIALQQPSSPTCTRIRVRPSPDGIFPYQLNLTDILYVTIGIVPSDAYAIILIVDQDLYEDEEDDFCCGRAYGGSRVCVVSSARYNPVLHKTYDIEREHMWPASHCEKYTSRLRNHRYSPPAAVDESGNDPSPMRMAVAAFQATVQPPNSESFLHGLWLFCVARTASHELGHCFGMDHCVYYACVMQGTASITEDCRQPPYLCPVCAMKRARAVKELSVTQGLDEKQYTREANEALASFCEKWKAVNVWAGFEAWLRVDLATQSEQ